MDTLQRHQPVAKEIDTHADHARQITTQGGDEYDQLLTNAGQMQQQGSLPIHLPTEEISRQTLASPLSPVMQAILATGDFCHIEQCGHGGEGISYILHTNDGRKELGKIIPIFEFLDSATSRIELKEVTVLKNLEHAALAKFGQVYELRDQGYIMVTREFIEGQSLREALTEKGGYSSEEVISMMKRLLNVLSYLHDPNAHPSLNAPVIHRDLKPENIIIEPSGTLRLIDFGLSHISNNASLHSKTVGARGTRGYMPLEQFIGQGVPASDIYSLGVLAIELINKVIPDAVLDIPIALDTDRPYQVPASKAMPEGLADILTKMVAKRREDRYQSAAEVLEALSKLSPSGQKLVEEKPIQKHSSYLADTFRSLTSVLYAVASKVTSLFQKGSAKEQVTSLEAQYHETYQQIMHDITETRMDEPEFEERINSFYRLGERCDRVSEEQCYNDYRKLGELYRSAAMSRRQTADATFAGLDSGGLMRQHAEIIRRAAQLTNLGISEELTNKHGSTIIRVLQRHNIPIAVASIILKNVTIENFNEPDFNLVCEAINKNTKYAALTEYRLNHNRGGPHPNDDFYSLELSDFKNSGPAKVLYAKFLMLIHLDHSKLPDPASDMFFMLAGPGKLTLDENHLSALIRYQELTGCQITSTDIQKLGGHFIYHGSIESKRYLPEPALDATVMHTMIDEIQRQIKESNESAHISLQDMSAFGMRELTRAGIIPSTTSEAQRLSELCLCMKAHIEKDLKYDRLNTDQNAPPEAEDYNWQYASSLDKIYDYLIWRFKSNTSCTVEQMISIISEDLHRIEQIESAIRGSTHLPINNRENFFGSYKKILSKFHQMPALSLQLEITFFDRLQQHLSQIQNESVNKLVADFIEKCFSSSEKLAWGAHRSEFDWTWIVNSLSEDKSLDKLTQLVIQVQNLLGKVRVSERAAFAEHISVQIHEALVKKPKAKMLHVDDVIGSILQVNNIIQVAYSANSSTDVSLADWLAHEYANITLDSK